MSATIPQGVDWDASIAAIRAVVSCSTERDIARRRVALVQPTDADLAALEALCVERAWPVVDSEES